jgi:hypothetical protein
MINKQKGVRIVVCLLLVLLFEFGSRSAYAQQPSWPAREVIRDAPPEEPVILWTETLPGGVRSAIQIPASADTYIASARPAQNFGSDALFLGYNLDDNFGAQRMLLHFNVLSAIPPAVAINSAELHLNLNYSSPPNDGAMGTVVRRTASLWDEHLVTWNTEPAWGEVRDTVFVGSVMGQYTWDVTGLVDDWVNGVYSNFGMEIIGDETVQQRERAFYAREATAGPTPRLVVDYTVWDDTEPPVVTVDALPPYSPRSFEVTWSGVDQGSAGIAYYDVQYRIDGGAWADWITEATFTSAVYTGQHSRLYEFRARGVDNAGNVEAYGGPEASTTVDTAPPVSTVQPLPAITRSLSFTVSWTGSDDVSGIRHYDVHYRFGNEAWQLWLPQTLATSATFTAGADGIYGFEVRAVNNAGLIEALTGEAETATIVDVVAPFVEPRVWLPLILR